MNFYGLWISNTNKERIKECISSGIWKKESYPNEENKEYERKKISDMKLGDKVFLYYGVADVPIAKTEFAQYLSSDKYDLNKTIVKVKSPAIGIVKSKNIDEVSLEIEWEKNYMPTEWYVYFRQDGIWRFIEEFEKKLKEPLYDIVFKHREFDYKWWAENLDWSRKKKNNVFTEQERDVFIQIANSKDLRYNNNANTYFQIYPKGVPKLESSGGLHYEFWKKKDEKFKLSIHVENRVKNYKKLRVEVFNQTESTRNVVEIDVDNIDNTERIFNEIYNKYEDKMNNYYINKPISKTNKGVSMKQELNQILYGPPGTGKTYNTIDKALQIIDGEVPTNREEAKERFEVLKDAGQIEFVTFHQSYGYEEFVEGIKATTNEKKEIMYDIQSGIFKMLSEKSLFYYAFKNIF